MKSAVEALRRSVALPLPPLRVHNESVAAVSDEVLIAYIAAGGETERMVERVKAWRIPFSIY